MLVQAEQTNHGGPKKQTARVSSGIMLDGALSSRQRGSCRYWATFERCNDSSGITASHTAAAACLFVEFPSNSHAACGDVSMRVWVLSTCKRNLRI